MKSRILVFLILIHLSAITIRAQFNLGFRIGPNYSKFYFKKDLPEYYNSSAKAGVSAFLSFGNKISEIYSHKMEIGYYNLNMNSIGSYQLGLSYDKYDGTYSLYYISLELQPRIGLFESKDLGLVAGLSQRKLVHARFQGTLKSFYMSLTDTAGRIYENEVDIEVSSGMNHLSFCVFAGLDYEYSLNEHLRLSATITYFLSLNGIHWYNIPVYPGGLIFTAGITYSFNNRIPKKKEKL